VKFQNNFATVEENEVMTNKRAKLTYSRLTRSSCSALREPQTSPSASTVQTFSKPNSWRARTDALPQWTHHVFGGRFGLGEQKLLQPDWELGDELLVLAQEREGRPLLGLALGSGRVEVMPRDNDHVELGDVAAGVLDLLTYERSGHIGF
jgi:hypothetical protein